MVLKNGNINDLLQAAKGKRLVCYGAGGYLRHLCKIFTSFGFTERIDFVMDSNSDMLGPEFQYGSVVRPLGTIDAILPSCCCEELVFVITTGAFFEVFLELQKYEALKSVPVYICAFLEALAPNYQWPMRKPVDKQLIPKTIHYCWFGGGAIPAQFLVYRESWRKYCPDYEIVEWSEKNYDFTQNRYAFEAYKAKLWAFVSDYARLDIIHRHGGIYLDVDVELKKPLDYFLYDFGFCGMQSATEVNTGLAFGAVSGNEIVRKWREYYDTISFCNADGTYNLVACPEHQTSVLIKEGLLTENRIQTICDMKIYPTDVFCPIDVAFLCEHTTDNTHAVHHFAATWVDDEKLNNKRARAKQAQELLALATGK